jgi:hypothetical protein
MYANTVVPFGSRFGQGADPELLRAVRTIIVLQTPALILINLQLFWSDVADIDAFLKPVEVVGVMVLGAEKWAFGRIGGGER